MVGSDFGGMSARFLRFGRRGGLSEDWVCVYGLSMAYGEHVMLLAFRRMTYLEVLCVINRLRFSSTGALVWSLER